MRTHACKCLQDILQSSSFTIATPMSFPSTIQQCSLPLPLGAIHKETGKAENVIVTSPIRKGNRKRDVVLTSLRGGQRAWPSPPSFKRWNSERRNRRTECVDVTLLKREQGDTIVTSLLWKDNRGRERDVHLSKKVLTFLHPLENSERDSDVIPIAQKAKS